MTEQTSTTDPTPTALAAGPHWVTSSPRLTDLSKPTPTYHEAFVAGWDAASQEIERLTALLARNHRAYLTVQGIDPDDEPDRVAPSPQAEAVDAQDDRAERILNSHLRRLAGRSDWAEDDNAIVGQAAHIWSALRAAGVVQGDAKLLDNPLVLEAVAAGLYFEDCGMMPGPATRVSEEYEAHFREYARAALRAAGDVR